MMSFKKITAAILAVTLATATVPSEVVQPATVCAASKIKLNRKTATIKVGKTVQLKVKGTKKKVKWSSSNTYVAKVSQKGKVVGKHAGSAKIIAKTGSKKLVCKIKVKKNGKAVVTKVPLLPTREPALTETPVELTQNPVLTEIPVDPTKNPVSTEIPVDPTKNPVSTEIPVVPTTFTTETPGKQVELALNFYLEPFNPEAPNEQFVNVHLVNHLGEDVYVETDAYLTTKGKDYPAMIFGSKEGDLEKIEPVDEGNTYGEMVMYDSKEYVMGDYTEETFWLKSDENSTLTFYFRIGEQRYKATINYNETGAVFYEATSEEILLPVITQTPDITK